MRLRCDDTHWLAINDTWDLEWHFLLHLTDSRFKASTIGGAWSVSPLKRRE
jgi:hypothetical protein